MEESEVEFTRGVATQGMSYIGSLMRHGFLLIHHLCNHHNQVDLICSSIKIYAVMLVKMLVN